MSKLSAAMRACVIFLVWAAAAVVLPAQTFTSLHSFNFKDGYYPEAALVQAGNGNLYGTAYDGGSGDDGTVFEITPSGRLTTLHNFVGTDGANPGAAMIADTDGNFYGATAFGGSTNGTCQQFGGCGTIFKITPNGTLTTLYNFCSQTNCADGERPLGALIEGVNGSLYGTTFYGGSSNDGTVFKIEPDGTLTVLHSFDYTDGQSPYAGLIQAKDGYLYGTTSSGGANGTGVVFKISVNGSFALVDSFNPSQASEPHASLIQASNGDFYGTTMLGGSTNNGAIFRINHAGVLTVLHMFDGADGSEPNAALVEGINGNLYGTTSSGGPNGRIGTVFSVTPNGTLTTLYSFCSQSDCTDGEAPLAALVQGTDGTFYGTTTTGGARNDGTVFSLSVGLGPFVKTLPTTGRVLDAVKILGTDLTGTTSVTFNGTVATFTVVSASEITTTVPTGATTGTVQVVTPGGTLSSNVPFRVLP